HQHPHEPSTNSSTRQGDRSQTPNTRRRLPQPYRAESLRGGKLDMRSRIYTIIKGHFKSWYRSKSNIFWTIAFPLLLIVLFGAIFGSGSTKFDLYLQNQDLSANTPTPLSQGYVNVINQPDALNLHMVAAEQPDPLTFVKN